MNSNTYSKFINTITLRRAHPPFTVDTHAQTLTHPSPLPHHPRPLDDRLDLPLGRRKTNQPKTKTPRQHPHNRALPRTRTKNPPVTPLFSPNSPATLTFCRQNKPQLAQAPKHPTSNQKSSSFNCFNQPSQTFSKQCKKGPAKPPHARVLTDIMAGMIRTMMERAELLEPLQPLPFDMRKMKEYRDNSPKAYFWFPKQNRI